MPAEIARSNETCCPAGQAGRLPYFLLHTYGLAEIFGVSVRQRRAEFSSGRRMVW